MSTGYIYDLTNKPYCFGEHIKNTKTMGELKVGDILYYQNKTFIGKCYIRSYPLNQKLIDENGLIKDFIITLAYIVNENGKEKHYKVDLKFGDINYEEFKNYSFILEPIYNTYKPDYDDELKYNWDIEIYSPNIDILKDIIKEKNKIKIEEYQEKINFINNSLNKTLEQDNYE